MCQFCTWMCQHLHYCNHPYLRNYTRYKKKKNSYIIFPHPLGNVYEVSWKLDHFLNFRHKWVKPRIQKMVRLSWNFIHISKRTGEDHIWNFIALHSLVPEISLWANRTANAACTDFSLFFSNFMKCFLGSFFSILGCMAYQEHKV